MSDTLEKAINKVVNVTIDSCIRLVNATETIDPADSHEELKALIVISLEALKVALEDEPVRLPN